MTDELSEDDAISKIIEAAREAPDEDSEVLAGPSPNAEVALSDGDKDRGEEEALYANEDEKAGVRIPKPPTPIPIPIQNPGVMGEPSKDMRESISDIFSGYLNFKEGKDKVVVTAQERADFTRSVLHDTELIFHIPIDGINAVIEVAIPSPNFTNNVVWALERMGTPKVVEEPILDLDSNIQYVNWFQQLHMVFQIRAFNGRETQFFDSEVKRTAFEWRKWLSDPVNSEPVREMNATRYEAFMLAMRIAEAKQKICLQNWRNKDFLETAGAA